MNIMLVGSSWTMGAWRKSLDHNVDRLDGTGLAQMLSTEHTVTNFSQSSTFNIGIYHMARDNKPENFDIILACQNDVFSDFAYKHGHETSWQQVKEFDIGEPISAAAFVRDGVDDLDKLAKWLLEQFYKNLASLDKPVIVFAGPSQVNKALAEQYGITTVEPDWCSLLVPTYKPSYVGNNLYLSWASELLIDLFPDNKYLIQSQFVDMMNAMDERQQLFINNPEFFAYHHPTARGNKPMADILLNTLRNFNG